MVSGDEQVPSQNTSLTEFFKQTTLHGAVYLTDKRTLRKVTWMLLMCAGVMGCGYQFYKSLMAYYERPFSTMVQTKWDSNLDFPAVTLCNWNPVNKARFAQRHKVLLARFINLTDAQSTFIERYYEDKIDKIMDLMSGKLNASERSSKHIKFFNNDSFYYNKGELVRALKLYGHTLEGAFSIKWLTPCKWKYKDCGAHNFTSFLNLRVGQCFTFNSGKKGHPKLNINLDGPENGLRLRLNVESEEHVRNFYSPMAGFRVVVHDPDEYPMVEQKGFNLQPGTHTSCSVKMKKFINLPSPYATNCASNETDFNRFFNVNYSMSTCSKQCLHDYGIKKCGCQPIYNITKGVPLCSLKDTFECIYPSFYGTFPEEAAECFRKYCPVPCVQTKYETKLSYATAVSNAFARRFPTDSAGGDDESLKKISNLTEEQKKAFFRDNIATLDVYFEELSYDLIEQKGTFDSWSLVANVGGYLGLFLGMSLLTVAEFLDLLVTKLIRSIHGADANKVNVNVN